MRTAEAVFAVCVFLVVYPYLLYPLILWILAGWFGKSIRRTKTPGDDSHRSLSTVSIVISAHNEQNNMDRRLLGLLDLLDAQRESPTFAVLRGKASSQLQPSARSCADISGEIIVVSDGSTDNTVAIVRSYADRGVRLLEIPQKVGKAEALSCGAALARNEILVFADVRQRWADDALQRMLENFADPTVGAVSGDLVIEAGPGVLSGVGLYWQYEKWIRRHESRYHAQVGVTGAISAVRRELFAPIPAGTLLDDVYWPLRVAMTGARVIHDERAVAYDRLPERTADEFRRKVRTLAGNFQLAARLPAAFLPWRNPVWVQWWSHKLMRLIVPWALIGLFVTNAVLLDQWAYIVTFGLQVIVYTLGLIGLVGWGGKLASVAASLLVLNAAAWMAFWIWITGRAGATWRPITYTARTGNTTTADSRQRIEIRS